MQFRGKTILITGAARGIGMAVAERLGTAGARLFLADINADEVMAVAERIRAGGGDAAGFGCDIADEASIAALRDHVAGRQTLLDLLINNAAAQQFGPGGIEDLNLANWTKSFDINVLGCVRMVNCFLPMLRAAEAGHIVNTSSSLAIRPNAVVQHLMPYVTSKGALLTFTYALAHAMQAHGIGVSLFCPGLTSTREDQGTKPTDMGWMKGVPEELTRPGSMAEAARILTEGLERGQFLISSDPGYAEAIVRFAQHGLDPLSPFQ